MFANQLEGSLGDPDALLRLAEEVRVEERVAGCRKLQVAAAWADCHGAPDDHAISDRQSMLVDRYLRMGGLGTPLVLESAPSELAKTLQTSVVAARQLVGDVVTIRHRLPMLWARVVAGEVWAWKACQIAQRTAHLAETSSREVDPLVTPHVELMAWTRFENCLDATLLFVDEATYQARAEDAAARRDARLSRDQHGLTVLVARMEAGDATAFMALVQRVAECLAEDGDEDPVAVRRSKAFGIIAHPARLRDLLLRHANQPDDPHHSDQRVAAHEDDPSDPWADDDLPDAGWQTSRHGDYHQPGFDDLEDLDDSRASRHEPDEPGEDQDAPDAAEQVDTADRVWNDEWNNDDLEDGLVPTPAAFRRVGVEEPTSLADQPGHCPGCTCGSVFDYRPLSQTELNACRTRAVVHVHVTDQTLIDQHGVLRTEHGPITVDQFRRWFTDADPNLTIRPVLDPAEVAPVDAYEIPLAMREAVHTRHPASIWPHSPATTMTSRLDLDHLSPYRKNGPPGQTAVDRLGPLARSEHRPKTIANWQVRHPDDRCYLWRSPHDIISLVTDQGTLLLGNSPWAQSVWHTAQPHQNAA